MKYTGSIALLFCVALTVYLFVDRTSTKRPGKTGVVQMSKLVYEFAGMKEASNSYSEKIRRWDAEADSLRSALTKLQERIGQNAGNGKGQEAELKRFQEKRQAFMDFMEKNQEQAQEEDKRMTLGVINQLNDYTKAFAAKEGFDLILCNNSEQQSVGYSAEQLDVTQQLLDFANRRYRGED